MNHAPVTVVVPVYRNATTLEELHSRLSTALAAEADAHVVFVDDASPDGSLDVLTRLQQRRPTGVGRETFGERGAAPGSPQRTPRRAGLGRHHGRRPPGSPRGRAPSPRARAGGRCRRCLRRALRALPGNLPDDHRPRLSTRARLCHRPSSRRRHVLRDARGRSPPTGRAARSLTVDRGDDRLHSAASRIDPGRARATA